MYIHAGISSLDHGIYIYIYMFDRRMLKGVAGIAAEKTTDISCLRLKSITHSSSITAVTEVTCLQRFTRVHISMRAPTLVCVLRYEADVEIHPCLVPLTYMGYRRQHCCTTAGTNRAVVF